MIWRVIFTPEAEQQLTDLYQYIANATSPNSAARYIDAIITYCEGCARSPNGERNVMTFVPAYA